MKGIVIIIFIFFMMCGCSGGNSNMIKAPGIVEGEIITMKAGE